MGAVPPHPPLSYKTNGSAPRFEFTSSAYEHVRIHFCPQFFQAITIVMNIIYLEGGSAEPPLAMALLSELRCDILYSLVVRLICYHTHSLNTHLKQALNGVNKWSVATPPRWYTEHAQVCGQ